MVGFRGCMATAARFLAGLLALLFVLALPLSVVAFDLGRIVFSPERMGILLGESFDQAGGFRRLAMEAITGGVENEAGSADGGALSLEGALSYLTPQERDYLAERLLPADWVREQLQAGLDDLYAWVDNDRARPSVDVDLRPVKETLRQGGADELIEVVVDSWPPCAVEQVDEMAAQIFGLAEGFLFCEPPEPLRTGMVGMVGEAIKLGLYALPDQLSVSGERADEKANPEVLRFKEDLRLARALGRWSWLLLPALLGLIMALVIRSWRGMAWWWGLPLILGGLLTLVAAVGVRLGARAVISGMVLGPGIPPIMAEVLHSVAEGWVTSALRAVGIHAGIILLVGGVLFALGLWRGRRAERAAPPAARPPAPDKTTIAFPSEPEPPEGETPTGMFG
jgi:hypothetical protein